MNIKKHFTKRLFFAGRALFLCLVLITTVSCAGQANISAVYFSAVSDDRLFSQSSTESAEEEKKEPYISSFFLITDEPSPDPYFINVCPSVSEFLGKYGLMDAKPLYTYDHTASPHWGKYYYTSTRKLELYYNEELQWGCIVLNDDDTSMGIVFSKDNFAAYQTPDDQSPEFFNPLCDPFNTVPAYADIGDPDQPGYKEERTNRPDGKPLTFVAAAEPDPYRPDNEGYLYSYQFTYRKDGTLEKKDYGHDEICSTNCTRSGYYDAAQRLVFEKAYITHGHLEYYTIYSGDSKKPVCQLQLDYNLGIVDAYFVVY